MLFRRFILLAVLLVTVILSVLAEPNNCATNKTINLDQNMQITDEPLLFDPNLTCRNFFLEIDANAPDYFQYYDCQMQDEGQTWPITVIYKVDGKYAEQAHQYLIKTMGMGDLKFLCCYWEQQNPVMIVNPKDNLLYKASFFSDETLKLDWDETIFYLTITGFRRFDI